MSEMSPEANAAATAAAVAVENAKEQEETREAAIIAADTAGTAAIESEIAAENANEALATAETAGNAAGIAAAIATDAADSAGQAQQTAEKADSEIQTLREDIFARLDEIQNLVKPPETDKTEVKEVVTNDGADSGSGDTANGVSRDAGGPESDNASNTGNSQKRTTDRRRKFHR
jgi:hypothetical protein